MRWMVLMVCWMGCAKPPPPTLIDSPAAMDEARLNAMVRELVPVVEKVSGLAFDEVPFVRMGRRTDLQRIVQHEAGSTFDVMYPNAPEWMRESFIRDMQGDGIAGKYALQERILLVSPDAMARMASKVDDDPLALDHVTRLILAHEMAHALQDQHSGISQMFDEPAHGDAFQALRGVTEGHANFVESRVAEELGLQEVERILNAGQGWDEDGPDGVWSFGVWAAYGQGLSFVRWHVEEGGLPRTWQLLSSPPQRSRTVFVPEEYGSERPASLQDAALLDGLESNLQDVRWFASAGPVVEVTLRERLFGIPAPELEASLAAIVGGAMRQASRSDRSAEFILLRFDTEDQASTAVQLPYRFSGPLSERRLPVPELTVMFETEQLQDFADEAWSVRQAVTRDGENSIGSGQETHSLWIRVGTDVLIIEATGFRPGDRLRHTADVAVERLRPTP